MYISIKARIIQYIEYKCISKYQFYKDTGIANGFLDKEGNIGSDKCELIYSQYSDLSLEWLITGKGSMLKDQPLEIKSKKYSIFELQPALASEPAVSLYKLKTDYYGIERQSIPLYEIDAAAGLSVLFSSQNTQVPLDFITVPNAPKCDGAVSVRGDSMYPLLKAGDIICYKTITNIDNLTFGEMYLLDIDNGDDQQLVVKYVQKSEKGDDYIRIVSENRYHAPKDIPVSYLRALAIVKLSIRYNTIS